MLTITINNVPFTYTAAATDTTTTILAASVANAINTSVQKDPTTQLPFGSLVHATSSGNVVTVNPIDPATSFTLTIAKTSSADVGMTGPSPASQTATVTGNFPAGSILTTTINGLDLLYPVVANDTATSVATNIAQSINKPANTDPVSNLRLNSLVSAAASGGVITVTAANATTAFTLAVTVSAATYTAGRL